MKRLILWGVFLLACAVHGMDLLADLKPEQLRGESGSVKIIRTPAGNALEFTAKSPDQKKARYYLTFSVVFPQGIDLQKKTVRLEVANPTGAVGFYFRAYAENDRKPAWSFMNWNRPFNKVPLEFTVTAGRNRMLNWEAKSVSGKTAEKVQRIQFYLATKKPLDEHRLIISKLEVIPELAEKDDPLPSRSAAFALPPPKLESVVELRRESVLVKDGKAQFVILHPDTAAGKAAAEKTADAVRQITGAAVPYRPGTAADRIPEETAVILGNLGSNPALQVLYTRHQTLVDEFLPGAGGWTLETLIEPLKAGKDVVILGASDDAGLPLAVEEWSRLIRKHGKPGELILPQTFAKKYTVPVPMETVPAGYREQELKTAQSRLLHGTHTSIGGMLAYIGQRYLLHRRALDAQLYVELAKLYAQSARKDVRRFGGAWGFDSDFPSFQAIGCWDVIEHDPSLTAEDRLAVSNMMLRWIHEAIFNEARGGLLGDGPVSNHLTFSSLGSLMGSFYFGKYYSHLLPHPAVWRRTVESNFARQIGCAKALDDCDGYQWLTWHHIMIYSMALPSETVYQNGVMQKVMNVAFATMDNLGHQAPYGDTNGWKSTGSLMPVLSMYYAARKDPLAAQMLDLKRSADFQHAVGAFYCKTASGAASGLRDGVTVIPLDREFYRLVKRREGETAYEKTFDKIAIRAGLDPAALYLLIDGINNGEHRHDDANSVLRFTQYGREWLAENEYTKPQLKYHNSLSLLCNGESDQLPDYMELGKRYEDQEIAAITVRTGHFRAADWARHYIWLKKDQAWMLIDEITAKKSGDFRVRQRWNGLGNVCAMADGYLLEQQGSKMRLLTSGDLPLSLRDDPELGKQWNNYPFADPVIRVMDQSQQKTLAAGETIRLAALWHGADQGKAVPAWRIDRQEDGFTVLTGSRKYRIALEKGDLCVTASADRSAVKPRTGNAPAASAGGAASSADLLWRTTWLKNGTPRLTAPENRKKIPFTFQCTESAPGNVFFPNASNALRGIVDGSWHDGVDSVMFPQDQRVTVDFDFETEQEISGVEVQLWWASTSSKNTAYKLHTADVYVSSDHFQKDCRKVFTHDAAGEKHPDFGSPVPYRWDFSVAKAKQLRIVMKPQTDTAIYLGEVTVLGSENARNMLRTPQKLTCVTHVADPAGAYFAAGSAEGGLLLRTADGKELAQYQLTTGINAMTSLDVDKDGAPEMILACQDGSVRAINRAGKELWCRKFGYHRGNPNATIIRTADADGNGEMEIYAGCDNWRTYALDLRGKELWNYEVIRPTRAVHCADLEGDGKTEILCGSAYVWAVVLEHQGLRRWGSRFGVGCRAIAAPLNGKGRARNVVLGVDTGLITVHDAKTGAEQNRFFTGDEIYTMTEAQEKSGVQDFYAASLNGYVYRFAADGSLKWCTALPSGAKVLTLLPDDGIAAGTESGDLCWIAPDGKLRGSLKLNGEISGICRSGNALCAVTSAGEMISAGL